MPSTLVFAVRFVLLDDTRGMSSTVTPSAKEPGRWQWTWYDYRGPAGDTQRDTPAEAIDEALRDGWVATQVIGPDAEAGERILADVTQARARIRAWSDDDWLRGDPEENPSVPLADSALSVIETDVTELARDPLGFGLTTEEAQVYELLADAVDGRRLLVPVDRVDCYAMADLLDNLSNAYDDQAEYGYGAVDRRFARAAARSLGTAASKVRRQAK